jgi:hypothetical protein
MAAGNNIVLLTGKDNLRTSESRHINRIVRKPTAKFTIFIESSGSIPSHSSGTINHEIIGPQYPFIASLKFPTAYFCAIVM